MFKQRFRRRLYAYPWKSALNDKPLSERKRKGYTGGFGVVMGRKLFRNDTVLTSFRAVTAVSQTMDDASTISNSKHGLFPRSTLRPPPSAKQFPISNFQSRARKLLGQTDNLGQTCSSVSVPEPPSKWSQCRLRYSLEYSLRRGYSVYST